MSPILNGIRVLDLSRILAGPWATQILADLGAEVIKIEHPDGGDDTRRWGPPFLPPHEGANADIPPDAAYYLGANRGKRSVVVDMATAAGQVTIKQLAATSDILVENFKVGGLAKYGLDYQSLHKIYPELIYCSITGFGQTGPYKDRAGYDFMIQAMGGMMSLTGERDDRPGGGAQKAGTPIVDIQTGLYAVIAILAALRYRDQQRAMGQPGGQHIDLALLDVQAVTLAHQAMIYLVAGIVPGRMGNAHPTIAPYRVFRCADGECVLAVGNDGQFRKFCGLVGHTDLAQDPRFLTNELRVQNRVALDDILEPIMQERPVAAWNELFWNEGVPFGPVNRLDQVFNDPQIQSRDLVKNLTRSNGQNVPSIVTPIKFSASPITPDRAPPVLGEDTDAVMRQLLQNGKN
ncbi:MAG: CoA transferase [Candidatus Symbiobacter sp.]|nr:CoA transferase [Candidatus Symbiobacter sp.]